MLEKVIPFHGLDITKRHLVAALIMISKITVYFGGIYLANLQQ